MGAATRLPVGIFMLRGCRRTRKRVETKLLGMQEITKLWQRTVEGARVVLDVGAYSGFLSLLAAQWGLKVTAVEPKASLVKRIKDNAEINELEIKVLPVAASDFSGRAPLYFPEIFKYSFHGPVLPSGTLEQGSKTRFEEVDVIQLDSLNLTSLDAMAVDVNGLEPAVLRGALNLIDRFNPKIMVRAFSNDSAKKILETLPEGYQIVSPRTANHRLMERV